MNKLALVAAAALSVATFGMAAVAQDNTSSSSAEDMMSSSASMADFTTADSNADGSVSFDEALVVFPDLTQDQYNAADANGDGTLDETEFTTLATTMSSSSMDTSSSSSAAM